MKNTLALDIESRLARSKKYGHLCPATLKRISEWAAERHKDGKEAEKAAKRKLHQIYAAYMTARELKKIENLLEQFQPGDNPAAIKELCLQILDCHASARERIPHLPTFYRDIKRVTGEPGSVLDLSCGLNPFTIPWLGLSAGASYRGIDIDCSLIDLINTFLAAIPGDSLATCRDILVSPPTEKVDMALLLKSLPCLEQQEQHCSLRLLKSLNARHLIVSFPTRSLGGRDVGMSEHYDDFMSRLTPEVAVEVSTLSYPNETVYVIEKRDAERP